MSLRECFTLAGAIVAFLIAVFTLWDRWARGRPLAWVTAEKNVVTAHRYIRVQNPGPVGVFIKGARPHPSTIYGIAKGHLPRDTAEAAARIDVNVLLRPGETHDLLINDRRDQSKDAPSRWVLFLIYWRKTSTWLPQVPVWVWTSTGYIERSAAAALREKLPAETKERGERHEGKGPA